MSENLIKHHFLLLQMEHRHHFCFLLQDLPGNMESLAGEPARDDPVDECQLDDSAKDPNGLSGIYWVNLFLLILPFCSLFVLASVIYTSI